MASKKEVIQENEVLRDKLEEMNSAINEVLSIVKGTLGTGCMHQQEKTAVETSCQAV